MSIATEHREEAAAITPVALPHHAIARPVVVIESRSGWRLVDWKELVAYRDLFTFLVWRGIKVRYAQSAIGIGWAIIQPVFSMLVFTIVFGTLAEVPSDGAPFALFSLVGVVPWTYFSNALTDGAGSLTANINMLTKVYFPRLLMPFSAVASKLVDFAIAMGIVVILMIYYQTPPNWGALMLPYLTVLMMLTAAGLGAWLTALAVQYRDVKHAMTFIVQIGMYAAPVVYPVSLIPERYRLIYALNPMAGVIEGFRSGLLGTQPMPWDMIAIGSVTAILIAVSGILYFRRKERLFADVA